MRTLMRVALATVLAMAVAACGGDDDTATDASTTSTAGDGGGSTADDGGDDGATDAGVPEGLLDEDCQFLLTGAFFNPLAAAVPGADVDYEASAEQLEAIADQAPEEIQDAMATLSEGYAAFAEVLKDVDFSDPQAFADPDLQAELADLEDVVDDDYQEVSQLVSDYIGENCGAG